MSNVYKAFLDDLELDISSIDDRYENAIAKYEYPFQNGADLDNMGQRARPIQFRCYFHEETYDNHKTLISYSKENRIFQLVHPQYGLVKGCIETVSIHHDDRISCAEIDVSFIEKTLGNVQPTKDVLLIPAIEEHFAAGQSQAMAEYTSDLKAAIGSADAEKILKTNISSSTSLSQQLLRFGSSTKAYIRNIDASIKSLESAMITIENPANSIINTIDYGTTLPGRVIGAVARTTERYAVALSKASGSPVTFANSFKSALAALQTSASHLSKEIQIVGAQILSVFIGSIYDDDQKKRQDFRRQESLPVFDDKGRFRATTNPVFVFTADELDSSVSTVRSVIQGAIDRTRNIQSLKDMALVLLQHVNDINLERDRILTKTIRRELPVHMICLLNGLHYSYADRICSINNFVNPAFVEGPVNIYARQS
jgi:hypothetical protein